MARRPWASADHTSSGTINITGGNLTVIQSGTTPTFSTTGVIDIGLNRTLTITGGNGLFNYDAGTLGGLGTLSLDSTIANFTPNFSNTQTTLLLNSSTLNGPGTLTNAATLELRNSTITAPLVNQGLLLARGTSAISSAAGSFTTNASSIIRVRSQANGFSSVLNVTNSFTNNGRVELLTGVGGGEAQNSTLNVTAGGATLTNAVGGVIQSVAGGNGVQVLDAQVTNLGTIDVGQSLNIDRASADHTSSGTINITGGNLTVIQSGTTPTFSTTGVIDIGLNRTLTITGGNGLFNYDAGTLGGLGTLSLDSTIANFTPNFSNTQTTLLLNSSTLNGPGTLTNAATLELRNSTITAPLVNQGLLLARGTSAISSAAGSFTTNASSIIRVRSQANGFSSVLNVTNSFTNNGRVELLTGVGGGEAQNSTLNVTAGGATLTNAVGGVIQSVAGGNGVQVLDAQVTNLGTIDVGQSLNIDRASAQGIRS